MIHKVHRHSNLEFREARVGRAAFDMFRVSKHSKGRVTKKVQRKRRKK